MNGGVGASARLSVVLAITAVTACGGATAAPPDTATIRCPRCNDQTVLPPSLRGFHPGESMAFAFAIGGLEVGEAALAVGHPGVRAGRPALIVGSRISTEVFEVGAALESTLDRETGLTVAFAGEAACCGQRYRIAGRVEGPTVEVAWDRGGQAGAGFHDLGGVPVHDVHSAMAAVRGWDGADAALPRRLYLVGVLHLWRADLTWGGREVIGTRLGNRAAVRVNALLRVVDDWLEVDRRAPTPEVRFSVWLSDDADRVPLRVVIALRVASAAFELTSYRRSSPPFSRAASAAGDGSGGDGPARGYEDGSPMKAGVGADGVIRDGVPR